MGLKKSNQPKLAGRLAFSRASLAVFVVLFAGVGSYFLWRGLAAPTPPTIYLSPASQTFGPSTSFSVQVRENSGTTSVNAVQANLSYPATLVDFVSIDYTGSAFANQAQSTGGSGSINIARGVGCATTCTPLTGDQLVATINFKTKLADGAAAVAFTSGTALVSSSTNQDILGSLAATGGGTYTVDTTAPTVSVSAPANNATLAAGSTVAVNASASDSSAVAKVDIYIDGALAVSDTTSPYSYNWNTSGLGLGSHTIQAKATDSFGNLGTSSTVTVNLTDQTAPTAPGSFRNTGATITSINLAWNASTDNIGVTAYKIKRAGVLIATITPPTLTYADTGLSAGTSYSYTIQAFDAAGNASGTATLNTSTLSLKPGDLNADGKVDVFDLSILLSNYDTTNAVADINKDGVVNIFDLSILLSNYGT